MYFFRYGELKRQLLNKGISDRTALLYLILTSVMTTLWWYPDVLFNKVESNVYDVASLIKDIVFVIVGTCYVYHKNGENDGFDLIQKFTILGWVLGCRIVAVVIIAYAVLFGLMFLGEWDWEIPERTTMLDVIINFAILSVFFYRLGAHIKDTTD